MTCLSVEDAGLREVVVIGVVVARHIASHGSLYLAVAGVVVRAAEAVGEVVGGAVLWEIEGVRFRCLNSHFYLTKRVQMTEFIALTGLRQNEKMSEGKFQTFSSVFYKISWLKILLEFRITNEKNL